MVITQLSFAQPSTEITVDCGWKSGAVGRRDMMYDVAMIMLEKYFQF